MLFRSNPPINPPAQILPPAQQLLPDPPIIIPPAQQLQQPLQPIIAHPPAQQIVLDNPPHDTPQRGAQAQPQLTPRAQQDGRAQYMSPEQRQEQLRQEIDNQYEHFGAFGGAKTKRTPVDKVKKRDNTPSRQSERDKKPTKMFDAFSGKFHNIHTEKQQNNSRDTSRGRRFNRRLTHEVK